MKSLIYNDKLRRKNFFFEEKNLKLEKLIKKNNFIFNFQKYLLYVNTNFKINVTETRLKNCCLLTSRSSSISRIFRISRIKFRELGRQGLLTGLKKSSW